MNRETLIIDDDEISLMLTELLFTGNSFFENSKKFLDGSYAFDYLKSEYQLDKTYIILLDINMPLMNGWEFLESLTPLVSEKNVFVFMLTSSIDKVDLKKSEKSTLVKGFFSKPLKKEDLIKIEERTSQ